MNILAQAPGSAATLPIDSTPLASSQSHSIDLVILDGNFRGQDPDAGAVLCQQLKTRYPSLPILVLTAQVEPATLLRLWQVGVEGYWLKGTELAELIELVPGLLPGNVYGHLGFKCSCRRLWNDKQSVRWQRLQPNGGAYGRPWVNLYGTVVCGK